ncbi:MAG: restriction endonuclease subunit S [Bacteroidaceae bacterium]|nr:restriction endonuclease subunit S [Bacteroidaceae bacterium]
MKEGWRMVKLGEVCDRFGEYGMSVSSKPYDGIRYIRITDITDDGNLNDDYVSADINYIDDDYRLQKGDVLFARTGATVGKTLVYKEEFGECVYAGYLIRYRPNLSLVLPQFLFYCTHYQEYYNWVKNNQKAAAQPNISAKLYNGYEFPLPPLEEQHRIVSILDASFEKIDALKKNAEENLKNAKALFQQVLAQELKPKEGWVEKKIGEVCEVINGRAYKQNELLNKGKYKVLRVGNFFTNNSWYYSDLELEENKYCDKGDLLYAWSASFGPKIWDGERVIYHYHIWKMICNDCIDKFYMHYYLQSSLFIHKALKDLHGTTMAHITKGIMESTSISFPSIEEQHRIVSTLDTLSEKCRRLEQVAQQTIRECDALKQSILRQAFSGKL